MSLTFLPLLNYREAEIRIHFNWNTSLALDHSSSKCSFSHWSDYSSVSGEILVLGRLGVLPLTRTSIRARVRLHDTPNIPLSPHCPGINNNDNISNPQIGAAVGFHFQLILLLEVIRCILSWSIAETRSRSSLDALTKFVPLSLNIFCGHPLRAVILSKASRNASVSKDEAISKWQQWVFKQRKHR